MAQEATPKLAVILAADWLDTADLVARTLHGFERKAGQ